MLKLLIPSSKNKRKNNKVFTILKLLVSLILIGYLVWLIDWEKTVYSLSQANKIYLGIAPILLLTQLYIGSQRWRIILADNSIPFKRIDAYFGYLLGEFYGIFLPGVLGGDTVRVAVCKQKTKCTLATAATSVLLERVCGVIAVILIAFSIYTLYPDIVANLISGSGTWWIAVFGLVGILSVFSLIILSHHWSERLKKPSNNILISFLYNSLITLSTIKIRTLVLVILLAGLFQTFGILINFVIARGLNINLTLPVFFAITPLIYLATILPISLGGLGVREGTLVLLLSRFNIDPSISALLAFLIYINRMFVGGIGGLTQMAFSLISIKKVIDPSSEST